MSTSENRRGPGGGGGGGGGGAGFYLQGDGHRIIQTLDGRYIRRGDRLSTASGSPNPSPLAPPFPPGSSSSDRGSSPRIRLSAFSPSSSTSCFPCVWCCFAVPCHLTDRDGNRQLVAFRGQLRRGFSVRTSLRLREAFSKKTLDEEHWSYSTVSESHWHEIRRGHTGHRGWRRTGVVSTRDGRQVDTAWEWCDDCCCGKHHSFESAFFAAGGSASSTACSR